MLLRECSSLVILKDCANVLLSTLYNLLSQQHPQNIHKMLQVKCSSLDMLHYKARQVYLYSTFHTQW